MTIARRTLGINGFELTGKPTVDYRLVCIEDLQHALEAAYDAGRLSGHQSYDAAQCAHISMSSEYSPVSVHDRPLSFVLNGNISAEKVRDFIYENDLV